MKKIILLSTCILGLSTLAMSQEVLKDKKPVKGEHKNQHQGKHNSEEHKKTAEERAQKSVEHLDKQVGLTDDQKTKIKELALARAQKVDALREKYKGQENAKEEAKKEIWAVKKEYRSSVKAILSEEQINKLKAKAKENGKGPKGPKGDKGAKGEKGTKGTKNNNTNEADEDKLIGDED